MAQLELLKQKRKNLKSSLTRFATYLNGVDEENLDMFNFKLRKKSLSTFLAEFAEVQSQIEVVEPTEHDEIGEVSERYFDIMSKAMNMHQRISQNNMAPSTNAVSNGGGGNNSDGELPKINLPKFSGEFEKWLPFYNTFKSLVHERNTLSDMQKYHYLISCLQGEAVELVATSEICPESYKTAWNTLNTNYNNKRRLVQTHISAIFELPSANKECAATLESIIRGVSKNIQALKLLGRPTDQWSDLLVYIIRAKLDDITKREWDRVQTKDYFPPLEEMCEFIRRKYESMEKIPSSSQILENRRVSNKHVSEPLCYLCKGGHFIAKCYDFKKLSVGDRFNKIKAAGLCVNCLKPANHTTANCRSSGCTVCHKNHNTLLHRSQVVAPQTSTTVALNLPPQQTQTLLCTAVIYAKSSNGKLIKARALLDKGSQTNCITKTFAKKLNSQLVLDDIILSGLNNADSRASASTVFTIKSRVNSYESELICMVVPKITGNMPQISFDRECVKIPKNMRLADPDFNKSQPIDILIGAEEYWQIVCAGYIKPNKRAPSLQKTHLGWIVGGGSGPYTTQVNCNLITLQNEVAFQFNLKKFWELEDISFKHHNSVDDAACETHFKQNYSKSSDGRFVVRLPFRRSDQDLGKSRHIAVKRFFGLERRFVRDSNLRAQYISVIKEFLNLGHMQLLPQPDDGISNFYLPHHAVLKADSITSKLRVVFDASAKAENGVSLNDVLFKGPVLQQDLFTILTRFRSFRFVLAADIVKMYRQVLLHPDEKKFHRIIWRDDRSKPLQTYELNTVTYGVAPASFLATRCLVQAAEDGKREFPEAAEIIKRDFYVDDLLTGFHDVETAVRVRDDIVKVLSNGGFELNKFNSNHAEILQNINQLNQDPIIILDKSEDNKTLGLRWHSVGDYLNYQAPKFQIHNKLTKRIILAATASIFDPLGLVNPWVLLAKLIIQDLWRANINWDDPVPSEINKKWEHFSTNTQSLESMQIPRCVINCESPSAIELHGFCDASNKAYGACIYVRVKNQQRGDDFHTQLLCAKSRVAPITQLTTPRLELCGALLLAELVAKVKRALTITIKNTYYYTDSTIVLSWLKMTSTEWKIFVTNRVAKICEISSASDWHYVNTVDNPADIISRGMLPEQLIRSKLWWHGPTWLISNSEPGTLTPPINMNELPERRNPSVHCLVIIPDVEILNKYSSFNRLINVTAYCIRFISNCKITNVRLTGALSAKEIHNANLALIRLIQASEFNSEIAHLKANKPVEPKSKLLTLNPFLDKEGIMRVGGRLRNALIEYEQKYPIVLPAKHNYTYLLYKQEHQINMHAGVQTTLAAVRQKYWPLAAKTNIKLIIKRCVVCFKNRPHYQEQLMGNLPAPRIRVARPFVNCGVDYCGPFLIKEGGRKGKAIKAYIAIFVCFATKAVHIEVVSNLTTCAFIAAMRRFISRRGKISNVYSDNGTNFVGANRELKEISQYFGAAEHQQIITGEFANDGISWHFAPPRSPHFGGLWEAAVKSTKHHLRRVMGDTKLTFEELCTLVTQIEAILNSRPLTPISTDPLDYAILTPGHFLIGDALTALPCEDYTNVKVNRLARWEHLQQMQQHFWKRWSAEYLHQLQGRSKWKSSIGALQVGQLVLMRDENLPPLRWRIGRIELLHPGTDGIVRAVTIRTSSGLTKRAAARVCVLPHDN